MTQEDPLEFRAIIAGDIITFLDAADRQHKGVVMFAPNKSGYVEIETPGSKCLTVRLDRIIRVETVRSRLKGDAT